MRYALRALRREILQFRFDYPLDIGLSLLLYHNFQVEARAGTPDAVGKAEAARDQFLHAAVTPLIRSGKPQIGPVSYTVLLGLKHAGRSGVSTGQITDDFFFGASPQSAAQVCVPVRRLINSRITPRQMADSEVGQLVRHVVYKPQPGAVGFIGRVAVGSLVNEDGCPWLHDRPDQGHND